MRRSYTVPLVARNDQPLRDVETRTGRERLAASPRSRAIRTDCRESLIGIPHASSVDRLTALLIRRLGIRAIVRVQGPIILDRYSEPQPDLIVLAARGDFYSTAHPRPRDVLLAIEVMDTSRG
jgi:hypothetical protein